MISSMTAYASYKAQNEDITLCWEVRSVNHKYLEVAFKLPEEMRDLEHIFRELGKKNINRGKLDCNLKFISKHAQAGMLQIDDIAANQVINACSQIAAALTQPGPIAPIDILRWPGVLQNSSANLDKIQNLAKTALEAALEALNVNKQQEGNALLDTIQGRLADMEKQLQDIQRILPHSLLTHREKLQKRLEMLDTTYDPGRLEQEMLYLAQKIDIAEEIDRLNIHLQETKRILQLGGMLGRRLDFMMQEIMRETNTIAAKSVSPQIALAAVELKILIEQIREQAQNLE